MPPTTPPRKLSGISARLLAAYVDWHRATKHIPKIHRYSLGGRIDGLFAQMVEYVSRAMFAPQKERISHIARAIRANDVLKFMLLALFDLDGISSSRLVRLTEQLEEVGRMLYGWQRKLESKNRPERV